MTNLTAPKRSALDFLTEQHAGLSRDHLTLWNFHEPSWREYRSARWYVDRLRREGFTVEEASAGMPTAFCATWSNGAGPTIGGFAEYDAVPGRSQAAVPYRQPREGVSRYAAGHTDPHSALGIGSFAAFLAAKHVMQRHNIPGWLKFFGEPAEKICGSKPVHAAHGYYDDLDAAFSFHPHSFPNLTNGVMWDTSCSAYWSRIYTFECNGPETWNANAGAGGLVHPHASARAPGAIDAVCLMYTSSKYMKEAMLPHRGSWSLNEFIPIAGQATADNLVPNIGQIQYAIRAPSLEMCESVMRVLDRNAEHCAAMTHCTLQSAWSTKTRVGLPNRAMAELTYRNFELVGPPKFTEPACAFAREIQKNLGIQPMENPFPPDLERLTPPEQAEAAFRAQLPPWQMHFGADDYVEYSWHAPTVRLYVARPIIAAPPGTPVPEWTRFAMGGTPACIDPMWSTAARVIALSIVDLLSEPALLENAQAEFRERTGGGIGGTDWVAPLLPKDFAAPIHYRWPEYVTTARGEEWTIPTALSGHCEEQPASRSEAAGRSDPGQTLPMPPASPPN